MFYGGMPNDRYRIGDHVCVPAADPRKRAAAMISFAREGLRENHKVVLSSDSPPPALLHTWLVSHAPDLGQALDSRQLTIRSSRMAYLPAERFDPDRMLKQLAADVDDAREEGYAALRVATDLTWCRRDRPAGPSVAALADYEARVNTLITDGHLLAVCHFNPNRFDSAAWLRIVAAHPSTVSTSSGTYLCRLRCERTDAPPGVRLIGEAEFANRDALRPMLDHAKIRPGSLLVDTADLHFCDVRSLATLIDLARARHTNGVGPTTIVCNAHLAMVLDIVGAGAVDGLSIVAPTEGRLAITDAERAKSQSG